MESHDRVQERGDRRLVGQRQLLQQPPGRAGVLADRYAPRRHERPASHRTLGRRATNAGISARHRRPEP
jgi:hypothetical protein